MTVGSRFDLGEAKRSLAVLAHDQQFRFQFSYALLELVDDGSDLPFRIAFMDML